MIKVNIKGVGLDPSQNPLLLLIDSEETMVLPIRIGLNEAQAISLKLEGQEVPRPLTHDLIFSVCKHLDAAINKVVVNDIYEGVYYAQVFLQQNGEELIVDSRPSDGIALALTSDSPLYISEKVAEHTLPFEETVKENVENVFGLEEFTEEDDEEDKGNDYLH